MNKTASHTICRLICCTLLLCLSACSGGGMSSAQLSSLGQFIDELDKMYADGDADLASGKATLGPAFVLASNQTQYDIVTTHLASHSYPPEIQAHFDAMKAGLETAITLQKGWAAQGLDRDSAPADEVAASDDAAMQFTEAETQLRIAAGR